MHMYISQSFPVSIFWIVNSNTRKFLRISLSWHFSARNFYIHKQIDIPCLNDFIQHLNFNFHLSLDNVDNRVLNALAEYDHKNPIYGKLPKTDLILVAWMKLNEESVNFIHTSNI